MILRKRVVENIVGKGEMHFLLFQQCFLPYQRHTCKTSFEIYINYKSANAFNLE